MGVDPEALKRASAPRGTRARAAPAPAQTRNPPVVNEQPRSTDLRFGSSTGEDNGQISNAGAARAREVAKREVRCDLCRRWTSSPVLADGGLVDAYRLGLDACADCAPAILRARFAVLYDEASDPRPRHLRFAPTHCRAVEGPMCDRARVLAALESRNDLLPPPAVPSIPEDPDARKRWVLIDREVRNAQ